MKQALRFRKAAACWLAGLAGAACGAGTTDPLDGGPLDSGPADTGTPEADADAECAADECREIDGDEDGEPARPCGIDCDDSDALVRPGVADDPGDGVDADCDGADGVDEDGDGWLAPSSGGEDCNDGDATVHPGANDNEGWTFETIDPGTEITSGALALTPRGRPAVAYVADLRGKAACPLGGKGVVTGAAELRYATPEEAGWRIAAVDRGCYASELFTAAVDLAVDERGAPNLCYGSDGTRGELRYASIVGAAWQVEPVAESSAAAAGCSLDIDGCGRPMVLYSGGSRGVELSRQESDGRWTAQAVSPTTPEGLQCLAVSRVGDAHVALAEGFGQDLTHGVRAGSAWSFDLVAHVDGQCFSRVAVALTPWESAVIAAQGCDGLLVAREEEGSWIVEVVDESAGRFFGRGNPGVSIAVSPDGTMHVAYVAYEAEERVRHASSSDGEWLVEDVGETRLFGSVSPSLAIDQHGGVLLAYAEGAARGGVVVATLRSGNDGVDQNCDGVDGVDADGDGRASRATGGQDLNDGDPAR